LCRDVDLVIASDPAMAGERGSLMDFKFLSDCFSRFIPSQ
jgi:hypothetical protein